MPSTNRRVHGGRESLFRKVKRIFAQGEKAVNQTHRLHVSLGDLYTGKTIEFQVTRDALCSACQPPKRKEGCAVCEGKGVVPERTSLTAHVERGAEDGQEIAFHGAGHRAPGKEPGDVVLIIEEIPHERFRRRKTNLITNVSIDLVTALTGGEFIIRHLDNRFLVVQVYPGELIKDGDTKVIHGQGMPDKDAYKPGDLYVKFSVTLPGKIDPTFAPLIERALSPREPQPEFGEDVVFENVQFEAGTSTRDGEHELSAPMLVDDRVK